MPERRGCILRPPCRRGTRPRRAAGRAGRRGARVRHGASTSRRRRRRSATHGPNSLSFRGAKRRGIPDILGAPGLQRGLTCLRWRCCRRRCGDSGTPCRRGPRRVRWACRTGWCCCSGSHMNRPGPGSEISRSRAPARSDAGQMAPAVAAGRWDISAPGPGAPRAWSRGAAVGTATARAFARDRMAEPRAVAMQAPSLAPTHTHTHTHTRRAPRCGRHRAPARLRASPVDGPRATYH